MSNPAAKQTRRSISVRGVTYDTLRALCATENRSMSDIVEELLASLFAERGAQAPVTPKVASTGGGLRPVHTVAARTARAESGTVGRPAPTPAEQVSGTKRQKSGDYRAIRF